MSPCRIARKISTPLTPVRRTASGAFTRSAISMSVFLAPRPLVEPLTKHAQRCFSFDQCRERATCGGVLSRLREHPEDSGNLLLGEPDALYGHDRLPRDGVTTRAVGAAAVSRRGARLPGPTSRNRDA